MEIFSIVILIGIAIFASYMAYWKHNKDKAEKEAFNKIVENAKLQEKTAIEKNISRMRENYYSLKKQISIPYDCPKVDMETTVFGLPCKAQATAGQLNYLQNDFYFWNDNDVLFVFPTEEHLTEKHITYRTLPKDLERLLNRADIKLYQIRKSDIEYYRMCGDKRAETKVQTGNTGVNVKGAIVGGIIAGEAGAVIGSQHNRNNVFSTTQHFDDRYVELLYKNSGVTNKLKLSVTAYTYLEDWYPDKEYGYVISHSKASDNEPFDEIKKYKDLLDTGIITQDEFEKKKKDLLNL